MLLLVLDTVRGMSLNLFRYPPSHHSRAEESGPSAVSASTTRSLLAPWTLPCARRRSSRADLPREFSVTLHTLFDEKFPVLAEALAASWLRDQRVRGEHLGIAPPVADWNKGSCSIGTTPAPHGR